MSEAGDAELVERVLDGSERAASRLVRRHHGRLVGFLLGKTPGREDARDLAQDTWCRVWRHLESFDPGRASFSGWIHMIADRLAANAARDRSRRPSLTFSEIRSETEAGGERALQFGDLTYIPDRETGKRQLRAAVEEAIEELRPNRRAVFRLRERRGLSYRAVADELGLELGTVKSTLHRARTEFREAVAPKLERLSGRVTDPAG